jgi:hypothetical protein
MRGIPSERGLTEHDLAHGPSWCVVGLVHGQPAVFAHAHTKAEAERAALVLETGGLE